MATQREEGVMVKLEQPQIHQMGDGNNDDGEFPLDIKIDLWERIAKLEAENQELKRQMSSKDKTIADLAKAQTDMVQFHSKVVDDQQKKIERLENELLRTRTASHSSSESSGSGICSAAPPQLYSNVAGGRAPGTSNASVPRQHQLTIVGSSANASIHSTNNAVNLQLANDNDPLRAGCQRNDNKNRN